MQRQPLLRHSALYSLAIPLVAILLSAVGCGDGLELVPVSGLIEVDGKPFSGARINTQPVAVDIKNPNPGPGSFGTTDQDGRYTLELATHPKPGAVVGTHRVTITLEADAFSDDPTDDRYQGPSRRMPPWFTDESIIIEVPQGGSDSLNLDLSTKEPPKKQ